VQLRVGLQGSPAVATERYPGEEPMKRRATSGSASKDIASAVTT